MHSTEFLSDFSDEECKECRKVNIEMDMYCNTINNLSLGTGHFDDCDCPHCQERREEIEIYIDSTINKSKELDKL
jgi:hypothetical protein